MKPIKQVYKIKATPSEVWDALTNPKTIKAWGAGEAKMEPKKGFKFSLWNGSIYGENLEVIQEKQLMQKWFSSDDPSNPTKVTFTILNRGDETIINLLHENVSQGVYKDIEQGWKDYYLGEIKKLLEK